MTVSDIREQICRHGASLLRRGLTFGSTGNISARLDDGWLMTPTNVALDCLDPARLARFDADGCHIDGDPPTKEQMLHFAFYRERQTARAVVHLHATHSVAVSCLEGIDPVDVLPPLTAYYLMRVGRLPLVPYFPPGDPKLAAAVGERASRHLAMLLANHGPVVAGSSLDTAIHAIEELEETARLFLMLRGHAVRCLTAAQVDEIRQRFPVT